MLCYIAIMQGRVTDFRLHKDERMADELIAKAEVQFEGDTKIIAHLHLPQYIERLKLRLAEGE